MSEISVSLRTYPNGNALMKIEKPIAIIQCGDYIKIKSHKYYIKTPTTDGNYRLFTSGDFITSDFVSVIAKGDKHLFITSNKLINSYIDVGGALIS